PTTLCLKGRYSTAELLDHFSLLFVQKIFAPPSCQGKIPSAPDLPAPTVPQENIDPAENFWRNRYQFAFITAIGVTAKARSGLVGWLEPGSSLLKTTTRPQNKPPQTNTPSHPSHFHTHIYQKKHNLSIDKQRGFGDI
ncbi:MAG TPA: hypothetical protein PLO72_03125, partial [Candidatus Cloacimonadota bacterium]|nr:hypothetical protein [Candidatus Cloacimonadota bacterium]HQL14005.1 hypothetical protein [Candidatus Cloacimonadota bacterium]